MKNITTIERYINKGNDVIIMRVPRILKGKLVDGVSLINSKKYGEELYVYEEDLLKNKTIMDYINSLTKSQKKKFIYN